MHNLYDFQGCDYAKDFDCLVDVHNYHDWFPEELCDVWMKAYDVSCRENARETELDDAGYAFDCYVWLSEFDNGNQITTGIQPRAATTVGEAKDMLIKMAESAMKDEGVINALKVLVAEQKGK